MKKFALAAAVAVALPIVAAAPAHAATIYNEGPFCRYQLTREELPALAMMKASENARYYGLDQRETQAEYEWHLNDYTNNRMAADGFFYQVVPVSEEHAYVPKEGVGFASAMVPAGVRDYGDAVAGNLNWLQSECRAGRNSAVNLADPAPAVNAMNQGAPVWFSLSWLTRPLYQAMNSIGSSL
ncbi:hypothetical protein [Corynebacterium cystitidis]|uniref:hypothetical protein n=1 Tax=Corynebacterium cystitidis TaxID=35757 RepID=UPI00211DEB31|nr:hypothetical protein [Corynebacterium cystitidis]